MYLVTIPFKPDYTSDAVYTRCYVSEQPTAKEAMREAREIARGIRLVGHYKVGTPTIYGRRTRKVQTARQELEYWGAEE